MSRLQGLNNALILVVLRYHECQSNTAKLTANGKTEAEILADLNACTLPQMLESLQTIINNSTKLYSTRGDLLEYFKKAISYTSQLLKSDAPLSHDEFSKTQSFLSAFITNMQTILSKVKGSITIVTDEGVNYNLDGLTQGVWAGYGYCNSGAIISKTLLPALHLTISNTSPQEIETCLSDICQQHQTALKLKKALQKIEELEQANATLSSENEALVEANKKLALPEKQEHKEIHARYLSSIMGVGSSSSKTSAQYMPGAKGLIGFSLLSKKPPAQAAPTAASMDDSLDAAARPSFPF